MSVAHRLSPLFEFSSMALVGASDTNHVGLGPYHALETLGYGGRYYPVNPGREQVHGQKAYPKLTELPEAPEMVVVAVQRDLVPGVIDDCGAMGVKAAVICSAGFVEQDAKGAEMQAHISAVAQEKGLLIIGPNCFGVASLTNRCAGISASLKGLQTGNVAVISNSGGLLNEITAYGTARGIGFSHLVSSGNEAGVTAADVISYFVEDPATDVIIGMIESVRNPALFVQAADRALAAGKPIVLVKIGSSEKGARSTTTHTGALAGSDAVYSALFRQKGIIRVSDLDELIDMGALFSTSIEVLRKRRLEKAAVIEISGGGKGIVADSAAAAGVGLPDLSAAAAKQLGDVLPDKIYPTNPLDTEGSWGDPTKPELYPKILEFFASQPEMDVVISRYTLPQKGDLGPLEPRLAELDVARAAHPDRLFAILSRTSDAFADSWAAAVRERKLPFAQGYGRGMRAFGRLAEYSRAFHGPAAEPRGLTLPSPGATGEGAVLGEIESKRILKDAGIDVVETVAAATPDEAVKVAERVGYPVALKVIAPEIVHKSDSGGVRLGLRDGEAVRDGFAALKQAAAGATFQGVAVQPMAAPGLEIVLGANRDTQFGPVIVFGLGGVFIEVLNDVALRVAPLSPADARAMMDDIRGKRLLDGLRGQPAADRAAIADALCKLSSLMLARPDIASVDVNPVFAYTSGLLAVDARVELKSA